MNNFSTLLENDLPFIQRKYLGEKRKLQFLLFGIKLQKKPQIGPIIVKNTVSGNVRNCVQRLGYAQIHRFLKLK